MWPCTRSKIEAQIGRSHFLYTKEFCMGQFVKETFFVGSLGSQIICDEEEPSYGHAMAMYQVKNTAPDGKM